MCPAHLRWRFCVAFSHYVAAEVLTVAASAPCLEDPTSMRELASPMPVALRGQESDLMFQTECDCSTAVNGRRVAI